MKPYYETKNGVLYCGDCLEVLSQMPDESVQCCITSPPYWGLRDYGNEPTIWDAVPFCKHVWGDEHIARSNDSNRGTMEWTTGGDPAAKITGEKPSQGQFCQQCGAWRGQYGLEPTPELYVKHTVDIFHEVKRILRPDGTLWLNLGDSYAGGGRGNYGNGLSLGQGPKHTNGNQFAKHGCKTKDLIGIPWRVAFALQSDGWYLRQDIIWHKPNPMPESVTDRCTKAHEYIFLMSKRQRYYYDADALKEPWQSGRNDMRKHGVRTGTAYIQQGRIMNNSKKGKRLTERNQHDYNGGCNKRSVWTVPTKPYSEAHFATFPPALIEPCIFAGTKKGDTILDPFIGSGTTAMLCEKYNRRWIGIDLGYMDISTKRIENEARQLKLFS